MKYFNKQAALFSILLMCFIDFIGIGLVYPMLSAMLFRTDINLLAPETSQMVRGLWLGVILALMPMAQFFSGPLLGTLSDRIGRKTLLLTSIAFGVLGYLIALMGVWNKNIILLALSRIIIGIAAGNQAVGAAAIADVSTPKEKAKNFGLLHMAAGLGFTVGPFLGGSLPVLPLGIFSGYAAPFVCAGLLSIINFFTVIFFFRETHHKQNDQAAVSIGFANIKKAWFMPGFFWLFLAIFFCNLGWAFYWEFIPAHWIQSYKFDTMMVGNMYAWGALVYAISSGLLIRPIVARFKTEKVLFYALILCALSIGLPLLFQAAWLYWIYIPMQQYFIALIFPAIAALVSNKSADDVQGEVMGILESVQSLAYIVGPLAAGGLLGITVKMPLIVGACTLLLSAYILRRSWFCEKTGIKK